MCDDVLQHIDKMYRWSLSLTLPDGTFPSFGDYRCHSILRMLTQGAVLRSKPELLWPAMQNAPTRSQQRWLQLCLRLCRSEPATFLFRSALASVRFPWEAPASLRCYRMPMQPSIKRKL